MQNDVTLSSRLQPDTHRHATLRDILSFAGVGILLLLLLLLLPLLLFLLLLLLPQIYPFFRCPTVWQTARDAARQAGQLPRPRAKAEL